MKYTVPLLLLVVGLFAFSPPKAKIKSAEDLIKVMKEEAEKSPLMSYTFIQETIRYKDGKPGDPETWYEAVQYPDRLRIDLGDLENGRTALYRSDSVYYFKDHELVRERPEVMEFLLLEGGIKVYSVEHVLKRMKDSGYDLSIFRKDKYLGRKVYVVGAKKGDLDAKQVWIDQERMSEVRRVDILPDGRKLEVQYLESTEVMNTWIPKQIDFYMDGKMMQREIYNDVKGNPELDPRLFEPAQIDAWHWYGKKD